MGRWQVIWFCLVFAAGCKTGGNGRSTVSGVDDLTPMQEGVIAREVAELRPDQLHGELKGGDLGRSWDVVLGTNLTHCDIVLYAKMQQLSYLEARLKMGSELLSGSARFADDIDGFIKANPSVDLSDVQMTPDKKFSDAAQAECESFLPAIRNSLWGCAEWFVADYLTYLLKKGAGQSSPPNANDNEEAMPFILPNMPFMKLNSYVSGVSRIDETLIGQISQVAGIRSSDPIYLSVISSRTVRAIAGLSEATGKENELKALKERAIQFFSAAPFSGTWRGFKDRGFQTDEFQYYCPKLEDD
jgi:hypothetical protein